MGELRRDQIGNAATEQGAALEGADFESLNHSSLPEGRPDPVEVDAEYVSGDGLKLTPRHQTGIDAGSDRSAFTLHEGPLDLLNAQLCEAPVDPDSVGLEVWRSGDIEVRANPRRLSEITKRNPREELVWYGMHPDYWGAASGDRIVLRRDILESQYSCKACKGEGYDPSGLLCGNCCGEAKEIITANDEKVQVPCRACRVTGYSKETVFSCGRKKCERCNGSGWKGGIVIPEESQTQAITGVVVSVGPLVTDWKIGDRLVFSRFAGHTLDVSKTESFIFMHQKEPIGILWQR